jgi:hypothetical protein
VASAADPAEATPPCSERWRQAPSQVILLKRAVPGNEVSVKSSIAAQLATGHSFELAAKVDAADASGHGQCSSCFL